MIVHTMTHTEVYAELDKDRDKFTQAQGKLFDIEGEIEYSHKFLKHQNLITI